MERRRAALPRGWVIQSVPFRRACEDAAGRSARARRMGALGVCEMLCAVLLVFPLGREVDVGPDPAQRCRARVGIPDPRAAVCAVFTRSSCYQSAGLRSRDGADSGARGQRPVRRQAAGLTRGDRRGGTDLGREYYGQTHRHEEHAENQQRNQRDEPGEETATSAGKIAARSCGQSKPFENIS
jgi:hypothetical protein